MHHDVPLGCVRTHLLYSQAIAIELQHSHDTRAVIIDHVSCVCTFALHVVAVVKVPGVHAFIK
jgi:hypothetical protein